MLNSVSRWVHLWLNIRISQFLSSCSDDSKGCQINQIVNSPLNLIGCWNYFFTKEIWCTDNNLNYWFDMNKSSEIRNYLVNRLFSLCHSRILDGSWSEHHYLTMNQSVEMFNYSRFLSPAKAFSPSHWSCS